jgi:hypothetical protein
MKNFSFLLEIYFVEYVYMRIFVDNSLEKGNKNIIYKHNDLFKPDNVWQYNACVGNKYCSFEYDDYAIGYFEAGERLVNSLLNNRRLLVVLILPIVFTYRHAIELSLKHVVSYTRFFNGNKIIIKKTHKLIDNWNEIKEKLDKEIIDEDTITNIDQILRDFINIDPIGEAFRYPYNKKDCPNLEQITHINLIVFAEAMKYVSIFFRGWFAMIDNT